MRPVAICVLAILALATPALADPCGTFGAAVTAPVGSTPLSFAAGDFNEDGITDLAVPNYTSHTISVLIGQGTSGEGNGTFASAVDYPAQVYPVAVVAADFNGDRRLDLAVSVQWNIAFYYGRGTGAVGDGTFDPPVYLTSSGYSPGGLATGDFNEDGIVDLAITNRASTTVGIWLGNGSNGVGDGTFAPEVIYFTGLGPVRVATGDFNEDGITDLVVTDNHPVSNNIGILIGNGTGGKGDGTFRRVVNYVAGTAPLGIAIGDFNSDTIADLAITNSTSNDVALLFGQGWGGVGDGTFSTPVTVPLYSAPREIVTGDYDYDGVPDLMIAQSAGFVKFLKGGMSGGVGTGTFTAVDSIPTGGINPIGLEPGDFHEDGIPDLVATDAGSASVSILPGTCPPAEPQAIMVTSPIAGGLWGVGSEQVIRWLKSPSIATVEVEVSRDAGATWQTIARNVIGSHFKWTVTPPLTTQAEVRVHSSISPNIAGTSPLTITSVSGVSDGIAGRIPTLVWPNPFRDRVRFQFTLPATTFDVDVAVFDVSGRLVKRLHTGDLTAGIHDFQWDGTGLDGSARPPGIYFMRAAGPGFNTGLKFIRIR